MSKPKKEKYVELVPRNDAAKKKLDYHGNRWVFKSKQDIVKFSREVGWLRVMSRDGTKAMYVKEIDDMDFIVRML